MLLSWLLWKLFQLLVSFDLSFAHFSMKIQPILDTQRLRSSISFHECMYVYTLHGNLAWRKFMNCIYILPTPMYHCKIQQCIKKYLPHHDETDKVGQNTWFKMTMHSAKGCCIGTTTMTLTSIKQKAIFYVFHVYRTLVFLKISIW